MSEQARIYSELRKMFPMIPAIRLWKQAEESERIAQEVIDQVRILGGLVKQTNIVIRKIREAGNG